MNEAKLTRSQKLKAECEQPNDDFFTHEIIEEISENVGTPTMILDFNTMLGDTIREKYETVWCKINEAANIAINNGAKGFFWIVTSPAIASIFETVTYNFTPVGGRYNDGQEPMGLDVIDCIGTISSKFRLYSDRHIKSNEILIGAGFSKRPFCEYAKIKFTNFIY